MEEWRAALWQDALREAGVPDEDEELGARLQAHFTQRRTAGFHFEPHVVVSAGRSVVRTWNDATVKVQITQRHIAGFTFEPRVVVRATHLQQLFLSSLIVSITTGQN